MSLPVRVQLDSAASPKKRGFPLQSFQPSYQEGQTTRNKSLEHEYCRSIDDTFVIRAELGEKISDGDHRTTAYNTSATTHSTRPIPLKT